MAAPSTLIDFVFRSRWAEARVIHTEITLRQ